MDSRRRTATVAVAVAAASLFAAAPATFAQRERAEPQRFDVVLGLKRHQQDLNRFARGVARPVSPTYGHYLTPGQVGRRFGAGRFVTRRVRSFLRRRGIESEVDVTRSFVEALAGPGKTRRLFGRPNGHERVPQALRGKVRQVLLQPAQQGQFLPGSKRSGAAAASARGRAAEDLKPPHVRTGTPAGCTQGQNATTRAPDGSILGPSFTPNQVQQAYGATPLHDAGVTGRGVRVAIFGASGFGLQELRAYAQCFGLSVPTTRLVKVGTRTAGPTDDEAALDLQMVTMMAPGLKGLTVYSIGSAFDLVGFSEIIDPRNAPDGHPPDVISASFGQCETSEGRPEIRLNEYVLAAAAATGVTVAAGSGDVGAFCAGEKVGVYPSASRWMTSVGGTAFTLNSGNRILDEIPWNDQSFAPTLGLAAGGGSSRFLKRPPYQHDLGHWGNHRGYPDVALLADAFPGIALYCNFDVQDPKGLCDESRAGNPFQAGFGTSAATPLFAGIVALADQRLLAAGRPPLGFVNPLLYRLGRRGGEGALRDIVKGSIRLGSTGCCQAFGGYDRASGWGSVNAERLAAIALERGPR
jgi:subtilase family serine protease